MNRSITKDFSQKEDITQSVVSCLNEDDNLNLFLELKNNQINDYIQALNGESKFVFLTGFAGVGKSEMLKITPALLDNCLYFNFDCFENACLDDIIFSLYRYFTGIKSAKIQRLVKKTFSKTRSIDERIFELLANFPASLLIAFDSFENLINESDKVPHDISRFLDFLQKQNNIKIVTASQVAPFELIKKYPMSTVLRIEELDYNDFIVLQKTFYADLTTKYSKGIFDNTRGIPFFIHNFFEASKFENPDKLFELASSSKVDFNSFSASKIIEKFQPKDQELLFFIASIRHPISKSALAKALPGKDEKSLIDIINSPVLYCCDENISLKKHFKRVLEKFITKTKKSQLHESLASFYEKQVPLKHFERDIKLSRTTLRNEFAFHSKLVDKKTSKANLIASTLNTDVILFKDSKPLLEDDNDEKQQVEVHKDFLNKAGSLAAQNIGVHQIENKIDGVAITEEERDLLYQEALDLQAQDKSNEPEEEKRKETIIDGSEIDHDFKKSKIIDNSAFYKLLEEALRLEEEQNYQLALKKFQKSLKVCSLDEKKPLIFNKIARCCTKLKQKGNAMMALKEAYKFAKELGDNQQLAFVVLNIARTLREFGDYKESEKHFNDYLDLSISAKVPKSNLIIGLLDYGDLYIDMNQEDNALTVYQSALKQAGAGYSGVNEIYFKIGVTFDNLGKVDKAKEFYERAAQSILSEEKTDKYYSESCSNLGLIYADEGDYKKALNLLEKAFNADNNSSNYEGLVQSSSKLADTYFDLKDYKKAQKYYYEKLKASKRLQSPYLLATAYLDIGDVYIRTNNLKKALRAFVLAQKSLGEEISTDSRQKISRRIEFVKSKITESDYNEVVLGK